MTKSATCALWLTGVWLAACGGQWSDEARPVAMPAVRLPAEVTAGRPVDLTLRFRVAPDAPAFTEDYRVFVHFMTDAGELIGTDDHQPPTATREWMPGSTLEYTRSTFAPVTRYAGRASVSVGLYSPATGERLPLEGESSEPGAIRVASLELRQPADPYAVDFEAGWNAPESPEGSGLEWRWSTKVGTLSFPNPKQDVTLVLLMDRADSGGGPLQVEVRVGETPVDAFDLESTALELRRIAVAQSVLGSGPAVQAEIRVDRTFVPSSIPELRSGDGRELGVRVFRAYVEPK
jgi:hypothetical protein